MVKLKTQLWWKTPLPTNKSYVWDPYTECLQPIYHGLWLLVLPCLARPWPLETPRCWGHVAETQNIHTEPREVMGLYGVFFLSFCSTSSPQCHRCAGSGSCAGEEMQKPLGTQLLPPQECGREEKPPEEKPCGLWGAQAACLVSQIHTCSAFWFHVIPHPSPFSEHKHWLRWMAWHDTELQLSYST